MSKTQLNIDEIIISHIFENKDFGCEKSSWYLRQYTNAYLTNYGNIVICKSNFEKFPKIKDE